MISVEHYLAISTIIFVIGAAGCLRRRGHIALVVLSALVTTLAALVLIVGATAYNADVTGPYIALGLVIAAAAQAGVAAALMICVYRRRGALALRRINAPKG